MSFEEYIADQRFEERKATMREIVYTMAESMTPEAIALALKCKVEDIRKILSAGKK